MEREREAHDSITCCHWHHHNWPRLNPLFNVPNIQTSRVYIPQSPFLARLSSHFQATMSSNLLLNPRILLSNRSQSHTEWGVLWWSQDRNNCKSAYKLKTAICGSKFKKNSTRKLKYKKKKVLGDVLKPLTME